MYIPKHFRETDLNTLAELIEANAFGTLITLADGRPFATTCRSSMTRRERRCTATSRARIRSGSNSRATREVLAIFAGPARLRLADVGTPSRACRRGTTPPCTSTARPRRSTIPRRRRATSRRSPRASSAAARSRGCRATTRNGSAGSSVSRSASTEIQGKFKLSQNRSAADRAGVVAQLAASGTDNDVALARMMEAAARHPLGGTGQT